MAENQDKVIQIAGSITVDELANALGLSVTFLIGELFKQGIVATINQRLDFDTASIIIEELGLKNVRLERKNTSTKTSDLRRELSDKAVTRPPVVAVMGHVDHGKTTLLDTLLHKKTVEGALGGILGAALVGMLFGFFVMKTESFDSAILWKFACMTLLGSILSQFGDLFASGIKRNHNLKDYGHLIPGHGGIMDRFDSVIFVTPFIYLMLTLFHLI